MFDTRRQQPQQPDALALLRAKEDEVIILLSVVSNIKERLEDDETATVEDALDDIRNHLEGCLIGIKEEEAAIQGKLQEMM